MLTLLILTSAKSEWIGGCNSAWLGDGVCDANCMKYSLNYDYGDCNSECKMPCSIDKLVNNACDPDCLSYTCGYDNGKCSSNTCAPGCLYSQLGDGNYDEACNNFDCDYDLGDTRTVNSDIFYVNSDVAGVGSGSLADPFGSIQEALINVKFKTTEIFLLSSEFYLYDTVDVSSFLEKNTYEEVIIQPKYCEAGNTDCVPVGTRPVIYLTNDQINFVLYGKLTLKSVRIEQFYEFSDCDQCTYCRFVVDDQGSIYSDQGNVLASGEYADDVQCYDYEEFDLFIVGFDGELVLDDVQFYNMRMLYRSLIFISGGITQLTNVDFYNIATNADGAAIYSDPNEFGSVFSYENGTISLVNNGYEATNYQDLGGFMFLSSIQEIYLINLTFEYNIVNCDKTSLIDLESVDLLQVQNCVFQYNFVENGGLIAVDQETLDVDESYNDVSNIEITGCTARNNSAFAVFSLTYRGNCQKITLFENTYEYNLVEVLISIESKNTVLNSCYQGPTAMYLKLNTEEFTKNYCKQLVNLRSQANIEINNFTVIGTSDTISYKSTTFDSLMSEPNVYLTGVPAAQTFNMQELVKLENCKVFTVTTITASSISATLLSVQYVTSIKISSVYVTSSEISDNELFSIEFSDTIDLSDLQFSKVILDNSNTLVNLQGPTTSGTVNVENAIIDSCKGGFSLKSISSASFSYITITNSKSSTQASIVADYSSSGTFEFKNSDFEYNSCPVLDLKSSSNSSVSTSISEISAKNIKYGSSLLKLDSSLTITSGSYIKNSVFEYNTGSPLEVSSSDGTVNILSCEFTKNTNTASTAAILIQGSSTVIITDCDFSENTAENLIHVELTSSQSYVETSSCTFTKNSALSIYVYKSVYYDLYSVFTENYGLYVPVVQGYESEITLNGTFIYLNTAETFGSVYINWVSNFTADSVIFKENTSYMKGAGLFVEQESIITLKNCTFEHNSAIMGSAIYIQHNYNNDSVISDCLFTNNVASNFGAIYLLEASFLLRNCEFYNNTAPKFPSTVASFYSTLYIENSQFLDHVGEGAHLAVQSESSAFVFDSVFKYGYSNLGASSMNIYDSELYCHQCSFENDISDRRSCIDCTKSICNFYSSTFKNIDSGHEGFTIYSEGLGSTLISEGQFDEIIGTSVYCGRTSEVVIENTNFNCKKYLDEISNEGAGVYCNECIGLEISGSSFSNLESQSQGGCVKVNSYESDSAFSVVSSNFTNCKSVYGGAISITDSSINITNCIFEENQAVSELGFGEGGSIYIYITDTKYEVNIINSSFTNNIASNSGGAIQWYGSQPLLQDNKYSSNQAVYGQDYASYSCKLSFDSDRELDELTIAPGQIITSPIILSVLDHYNQIVTNDNETSALIQTSSSDDFTISGSYSSTSSQGAINITGYIIYGKPGSAGNFSIKPSFPISSESSLALDLDITLRNCISGEVNQFDQACIECAAGTYNLEAGSECLSCPSGAKCYGGSKIVAASGYWRISKTSDKFFSCPNPSACLEEKLDSTGDHCASGYEGNCCQSCANRYSRTNTNECSACLDEDKNTGLLVGLLLIAIIVLIAITVSTLNGAHKEDSITSIYFKILMNYIQLVGLTISFDLSWPWFVKKMFQIQGKATGGSEQLISVDCFLEGNMEPYYAKLVILALVPFLCFIFSAIFWAVWGKVKKSQNLKSKLIGSMIVQLFFFEPTLVKYNFSMFNCTELAPGRYFMTEDMSITCWESDHLTYTLTVALPSLLIWCIGTPALLVFLLYRNRNNLENISEKLKYGFLYKGFKPRIFFWEFIILLKEVLIICCSVFLKNISVPIQALVVFVVILSSFMMQSRLQPYTHMQLNKMEIWSIVVSAVTIYSGLFFLTGDMSEEGKIIVFILMIIVNLAFLSFWIYFTFGYYIAKMYLKIGCCKKLCKGRLDQWAIKAAPDVLSVKTDQDIDVTVEVNHSISNIFAKRSKIYTIDDSISA